MILSEVVTFLFQGELIWWTYSRYVDFIFNFHFSKVTFFSISYPRVSILKDDVYLIITSSSLKICIFGCHNDNLDVLRVILISLANF